MPIFIDIAPKEVKVFVCGKKMSGANFNKKGCKTLFFWNTDNKKCIYTMYIYSKRTLFAKMPFYPTGILRVFYGNPTVRPGKEYLIAFFG